MHADTDGVQVRVFDALHRDIGCKEGLPRRRIKAAVRHGHGGKWWATFGMALSMLFGHEAADAIDLASLLTI
jgi:hypothetical protein